MDAAAERSGVAGRAGWRGWPWVVIGAFLTVTVVSMRVMGRLWWCDTQPGGKGGRPGGVDQRRVVIALLAALV